MSEHPPLSPPAKRTSFWTNEMQDHCIRLFGPDDEALRAIRRDAAARGFPDIAVSESDGHALGFLVASCGARRAVEIGTLGGYSGVWIARSLARGGRLDTFELDADRAAFAREHFAAAKLDAEVMVHEGRALANLGRVTGSVDFVFIDADKGGYPDYLAWAAEHLRPGGVVALDNAFAWGGLADPSLLGDRADDALAMRRALEYLVHSGRFVSAMLPTNEGLAVGVKRG